MPLNKSATRVAESNERQVVYKRVKCIKSHCSRCGYALEGNGSKIRPYKCVCGTWVTKWLGDDFNKYIYVIKND